MCNESAFVLYYPEGHRHLDDVDVIEFSQDSIKLVDMRGKETTIEGRVMKMDLVNRRIEVV